MGKGYNLYNLEPQFKKFLIAENISPISLKNYLSDLRYFIGWMNSISPKPESIDKNLVLEYRKYLFMNQLPRKTINRRLSTLRKLCSFCISQGWMKENPAKKIANINDESSNDDIMINMNKASSGPKESLLSKIRAGSIKIFERIRIKKSAVREIPQTQTKTPPRFGLQHYIGLIIALVFMAVLGAGIYNQFFAKAPTSLAFPTSLTRAGRILSFQGRLTDTVGNPITTATNVTFNLYNVSTGGTPIYTAGACSLTPDQDGIINVLVGGVGYSPTPPSSTFNALCGSEIDPDIFTENPNVYLGVTVASDSEMTPRQQIANVGYAINAETLQGFPPGTGPSSIPYINSEGDVLIAASNPEINSSYASSTFTISSANATTIQSAGAGDITLQATESGAISLRTGGDTSTYTRLFVDTASNGGNVGIGDLTPTATLTVGDGDLFQVAGASGNITTAGDIAINGGDITSTATTFNFDIGNTGTINFGDGTNTLAAIKDQGDYAFWNVAGKSTTGDPATCSPGDMYYNANDETIKICHTGNTWEGLDGGGSGSSVWSDLLSPTANLLLNMGTYISEFNWDTGTGTDNLFSLTTDASSNGTGYLLNLATGASSTVKPLRVAAGSVEALAVDASGNVGIGTTGQDRKLDVLDAANPQLRLTQADGTVYADFQTTSAGDLVMNVDGVSNQLVLDNGGNVGIGDSSPASLFTVGNGDLFRIDSSGRIMTVDGVAHAIDDVSGNLTLTSASTTISLNDSVSIAGNLTLPSGTITLPNSNTITGVSSYTQFSNGISVGGATTYNFNASGDLNANTVATGGTQRINSGGNLTNIGSTQFNGVTYTWPGADGVNGAVLATNGSGGLSWYDVDGSENAGPWSVLNGAIFPDNSTVDLFIGGTASDSAKFAFLNVNSGDPTASISGNLAITAPLGADPATSLDILNGGTFNIRNSVGGNAGLISRFYLTSNGDIGIGTTTPSEKLTLQQDDIADMLGIKDGANNTNFLLADGGVASFKPTAFDFVYTFDGVSTYANNTNEAKSSGGTPFEVLELENPSDDIFYVGLDHKFATMFFDIVTAGAGVTLVPEYWDGSSWTALTVTDNTSDLTTDGTVTFTAPTDWETTAVNSQTKYWVRFSSSTQVTTAPTAYSVSPTTGSRFSVLAQSGDTTNPSLYVNDIGNVGIGTNTPSTKLSIGGSTSSISNDSGDITIDAASGNIAFNGDNLINFSQALGSLGSDSAPTYSFSGDADTGYYSPGADTLALSVGSSEKMRIDSAGDVGIGTINPTQLLHIYRATDAFAFAEAGAGAQSGLILGGDREYRILMKGDDSDKFVIRDGTAGADRLTIDSSGNLDVGGTFQVTAATGNITTSGDLALNGGDLTSTGAITVTPNAGNNLNIALSTTGDLAVNTNHLYVDTSAANVGIGTATPNSSYKLHVAGNILADAFYDTTSPGTWFLNPAGASVLGGNITMVGDLFMTDGSPMISSNNGGTYNTITIKGSNDTTTPSLCVEGTGTGSNCDGKINAGTIDPPYTINGKKYATYIASMTGVKEETAGVVRTSERVPGVGYRKIIDFNNEADGSDLWLFAKTSKLKENIKDLVVLLTAADNTRTWFDIDKDNLRLTIYSSKPTSVSYRLTSPRFDAEKWKNIRETDDPVIGFVLTDHGDLNNQYISPTVSAATINNNNVTYNGNLADFKTRNSFFTVTGDFVDEALNATYAVFGRILTGYVETQNAVVENMLVARNISVQNLTVAGKTIQQFIDERVQLALGSVNIASPISETQNIKVTDSADINKIETNEIKPKNTDVIFDLSKNNPTQGGQLAKLIIKGLEGKVVTTIDSAGNATFSGQVVADSLSIDNNATVAGTLTASEFRGNEASLSGRLTAREIQSDNLTDLENRLNRTASDSSYLATSVNDIQRLLAQIQNEPIPDPEDQTDLSNTTDLSSVTIDDLTVNGSANFYNLSVSNSISTGNMLIEDNKILALSWDLNISSLSRINFFDGSITMARDGTITTRGELIAEGGIRTDEINPLDDNGNVNINRLAVDSLIINDKYLEATSSAAVIAAAENFELNGLYAPAIETATTSAGIAILPSNSSEIVIYNDNIKENSLVYLTPTSDYPQSGQLTVVKKEYEGKPYFKVSSNTLSALPVKFNWLIVN